MSKEFIAELHDIGKLVDKDNLTKYEDKFSGHTFEDFDFNGPNINKPTSPSWWGQYHHKEEIVKEDINKWKEISADYKSDLFFLIIADHLASSISRVLPQLGSAGRSEEVLRLWNRKKKGKYWAAFKTDEEFEKMFEIIDSIDSPEEFLEQYRENLVLTPEDKSIPRNVTSLYTHLELVGKIYRVLKKQCKVGNDSDGLYIELNGKKVRSIKEAEGGHRTTGNQNIEKGLWQARFIKCHIKFPYSFVRLQDINLLVKRNELIEAFVKEYPDYVMFWTHDFISLFLPIGEDLEKMFKDFINNGFFIDCVETTADLGILRSNLDIKTLKARAINDEQTLKVLKNRDTSVYKIILSSEYATEKISPPICDICQMQPAKKRIKENIREWLCDKCFEIRNQGGKFNYPEEWQDSKIIWLKFNLNHEKLGNWLQEAFERYVDSIDRLSNKQILKEEFRSLACYSDFVKDYKSMIKNFWVKISDIGIMKPISDYEEIRVCKYSGDLVRKVIEKFLEVHNDYFPDCDGDFSSPISLSLSISHIKYPIREHFRYFENPKGFLNIRSHNVFEETYAKDEIKWLIKKLSESRRESLHFLYKLSGLYEKLNSDVIITVEILNNKDRHPAIYNFYSKFVTSPEKILNFFRTIEEADEIIKA